MQLPSYYNSPFTIRLLKTGIANIQLMHCIKKQQNVVQYILADARFNRLYVTATYSSMRV